MKTYIIILLLILTNITNADSLYFSHLEQATIDAKLLKETEKKLQEHKATQPIKFPTFHQPNKPPVKIERFCTLCHNTLAHRKNIAVRSFLNAHSRFISCETCHFLPKNVSLTYRWLQNDASIENEENTHLQPHPAAHLSPFSQGMPVVLFPKHSFFQKIKSKWKDLPNSEQIQLTAKIHAPLKEKGISCKSCHDADQKMLELARIGASQKQQQAIEQNKIAHLLDKDETTIRLIELLD
ncbi:hypothetical protein QUF74_19320 [Candidatus Halobeggiatoa sp. HSG11]|nr:hypothetical protein [Candidatus Halobeggiatoa sp. HSG11]